MIRFISLLSLALAACSVSRNISRGIEGNVTWLEGDRMPGVNKQASPGKPVLRTLYIYQLANLHQAVQHDGVFYDSIKTRLVKKVKTNDKGKFSISLPPGKYTVFIEEGKGLYANKLDGSGHINPVTVMDDSISEINIRIDYKATY